MDELDRIMKEGRQLYVDVSSLRFTICAKQRSGENIPRIATLQSATTPDRLREAGNPSTASCCYPCPCHYDKLRRKKCQAIRTTSAVYTICGYYT